MKFFEKNPIVVLIIGVLGISVSAILVRLSGAPSPVTAVYRLSWTVVLLLPMVLGKRVNRQEIAAVPKKTLGICCLGGMSLAAHFLLWFESLEYTTVASSTVIVTTEVIWVALGFCLFMKGKISLPAVGAIALALLGGVLVAYADGSSARSGSLLGDGLALAAAIASAVFTLFGRKLREEISTTVFSFLAYCACAATLLVYALCKGVPLTGYGWQAPACGFLLALCSTILGHTIFIWCMRYFSPTFVSASKLCEPVISSLIAAVLFSEIPLPLQLVGSAIILLGVGSYSVIEMKGK